MYDPLTPPDGNPDARPETATNERLTTGRARRYLVAAAVVTGSVALGALVSPIGLAGAGTGPSADDTVTVDDTDEFRSARAQGKTIAELAAGSGVDVDSLTAQLLAAIEERLDGAVARGRLDQAEADHRLADAEERIERFIDRARGENCGLEGWARDLEGWARSDGRGDPDGRFGRWRPGGFGSRLGSELAELSDELGITAGDVVSGFAEGKTLVEIAAERGVGEQELNDALVSAAEERLDAAVADGRLDADRAHELEAEIRERVAKMITTAPGVPWR